VALPVKALKAGQESYWLDQIARNREEYFSGRGESPGRFVGSAAAAAGLDGTASPTICWHAETLGRLLGVPVAPLVCVHGAHLQGGGLHAQGVAIVPASLLRSALGSDQMLSEVDIERYAASARMRLRPAA
jgi:hypothetical protein